MQIELLNELLIDANASEFFESATKSYVILFHSWDREDWQEFTTEFHESVWSSGRDVETAVCMIEDGKSLVERFKIFAVPTVIVGKGEHVYAKHLWLKDKDNLAELIASCVEPNEYLGAGTADCPAY